MSEPLKENEASDISATPVFGLVIATLIIVVLSFIGLSVLFQSDVAKIKSDMEMNADISTFLAEQRLYELKTLTSLAWLDQSNGVVKLPISIAKQSIVQKYTN